uniref:hypothetical protein n=1 Tax=Paenibacillus wynnii TaxID=268407 RepID=UPI0027D92DFA
HPSYAGAWPLPRPDFHRLEVACLAGHAAFEASFLSENFRATATAFPQSVRPLRCFEQKSLERLRYQKQARAILQS